MSWDTIEAGLQTLLQALTSKFPVAAQVTRGDWRVMDAGYNLCVVLYAGAYAEGEDPTLAEFLVTHTEKLALIKRYLDDGTTRVGFGQDRDAVLEHLMKYPCLNGLAGASARRGKITSDTDVEPIFDKDDNGPFFLMQIFSIPVSEIPSITPVG